MKCAGRMGGNTLTNGGDFFQFRLPPGLLFTACLGQRRVRKLPADPCRRVHGDDDAFEKGDLAQVLRVRPINSGQSVFRILLDAEETFLQYLSISEGAVPYMLACHTVDDDP